MVAAVGVRASQAGALVTAAGTDVRSTQAFVLTAGIYPTANVRSTQVFVNATADAKGGEVRTTQAFVLVAAAGRVADPAVRAWTYSLDGHDFYVLRCGNFETLVCDLTTKAWHVWGSGNDDLWRAYLGFNWLGAKRAGAVFGSNIVVGDDGNGALYFLNPDGHADDDPLVGADTPRPFERVVTAQEVVIPGYGAVPCFEVQLFGSIGATAAGVPTVDLSYSDDRGNTFTSAGAISLVETEYTARLAWQSLGSMESPGRIFRITDYGALQRIDGLMMEDGRGDGQV